mmetsp:Transcript_13775/g.29829  ORF Transcript_13775/g.29829 Transcript_13775/m.29829 type:complete len:217 (-) Transcript_13775:66-716(-)
MVDGRNYGSSVGARAAETNASEPSQCCIPASCAQKVHVAQQDRPSDRVIARRRGAQRSNCTVLANLSPRDSQSESSARSNGAACSAGRVGEYDSRPVCAHQVHDLQHSRPRVSGVARPCGLDVQNCADAVFPFLRDTLDESAASACSVVSSEGCVRQPVVQHKAQHLALVRPPACVGTRACEPERLPTMPRTTPHAYAVPALHPSRASSAMRSGAL